METKLMRISESKCPNCFSLKHLILSRIRNIKIEKCMNCGLIRSVGKKVNNVEVVNNEIYSNNYINSYNLREAELRDRFLKRIREIELYKKGGKILDVGCGIGLFIDLLAKNSRYKWEIFGLDINKKLINVAKKRNKTTKFYSTKITKCNFPNDFFDCITCFDVLEHDLNIRANLSEINRIIKRTGILLIQVPNNSSIMTWLTGTNWDWWIPEDHLLHFTPSVLVNILNKSGFKVVHRMTWEPLSDFVKNTKSTFVDKLSRNNHIQKILRKLLHIPLLLIYALVHISEYKFEIGALFVVISMKSK